MWSRGFPGGWMSADSCPPLWPVGPLCSGWGGAVGFLGVDGPWLALGLQGVQSLQALTSGPRGPTFALGWAASKARSEAGYVGLCDCNLWSSAIIAPLHMRGLKPCNSHGVMQPSQEVA